jgi:hypothetical protein
MHAVTVAPSGAVYVAGQKRISISAGAQLIKYTADGRRLWSRTFLPTPRWASTVGEVVAVAPDGTVVWGGELHGQCEGGGWFLEWRGPRGRLLERYKTPDWECGRAERIRDIAVGDGIVVVAGYSHGCCSDPYNDGWIRAFGMDGSPSWETDIEPPGGTPTEWFDTATGVAMGGLGNIYVSGWAATERVTDERGGAGTPILVKVTSGGGVLWSRRLPAKMHQFNYASIAVRGDRVMVAAAVAGTGIYFGGRNPTSGWIGAFDPGGTFLWSRRWDTEPNQGAAPAHLAIDGAGATWVVGTRRDLGDRRFEVFVRRFGRGGDVQGRMTIGGRFHMTGTWVAVAGDGAYVTGLRGSSRYDAHGGRLWRVIR